MQSIGGLSTSLWDAAVLAFTDLHDNVPNSISRASELQEDMNENQLTHIAPPLRVELLTRSGEMKLLLVYKT